MAKRGVEQPAYFVAWNVADNEPATGDAANITLAWVKDGVATAATNSVVEVSDTLADGLYCVWITAEEADCALGVLAGTSSTEGVRLFGVTMSFDEWAEPGDAMTLTAAYDAAKTASQLDSEDVGSVVAAELVDYGAAKPADVPDATAIEAAVAAALATYGAATDSDVAAGIEAVLTALADVPSSAEIVAALYASTATLGGASFAQVCNFLTAMAKGKFTSPADNTYTWYADDGVTALFTLIASATGRTSA